MFAFWHFQEPASVDKINDKIYIGNQQGAYNEKMLTDRGITHVLAAGTNLQKKFPEKFTYHSLQIMDVPTQNLFPYFHQAIEFIDSADKILVHCAAGVSRSVSMVLAYFMIKKDMSLDDAFELVKSKRKVANPNFGFVKQLNDLQKLKKQGNLDLKKYEKNTPNFLDDKSEEENLE